LFPLVKESAGHRIERRPPGFEFTPGLLGKITTYLVIGPEGGIGVFAFMYSFLIAADSDEDRLAAEALALIEDQILASLDASGKDRTFEFSAKGWREVDDPRWWFTVTAPT
jgi:hypothetical protein